MEVDYVQATSNTTGKVALNMLPVLCGQQGVLQLVNVLVDLLFHRFSRLEQMGEIKDHARVVQPAPIVALETGCCMDQKS